MARLPSSLIPLAALALLHCGARSELHDTDAPRLTPWSQPQCAGSCPQQPCNLPVQIIGGAGICTVMLDGSVRCWDLTSTKKFAHLHALGPDPITIPELTGVARLVGTPEDGCALHCDGHVSCWGYGADTGTGIVGEAGNVAIDPRQVPEIDDAVDIESSFGQTTFVRRADGSIWAWGNQDDGSLAREDSNRCEPSHVLPTPVRTGWFSNGRSMVFGALSFCVVDAEGVPRCTGRNELGSFGNGMLSDCATTPQASLLDHVLEIKAGTNICALRDDGTVWCWGPGGSDWNCDSSEEGLYEATLTPSPTRVPGIDHAIHIWVGDCQVCAVLADGHVRCAGDWGTFRSPHVDAFEVPGLDHIVRFDDCAIRDDFTIWCLDPLDEHAQPHHVEF